ncbi:MAG: NAD(P)-dependent oxidoreductase [Sphaerochaetaceae bacterium]|nr:NAD(P)-dependent oxidoreductase [Sphaerochaetaceae bacterium]
MNILYSNVFNMNNSTRDKLNGHNLIKIENEWDDINFDCGLIDIVICNNLFSYHDINDFTSLKFVQFTTAGLDRVPLSELEKMNIQFSSARGVYSVPIAEWTISKILEQYKKSQYFFNINAKQLWEKNREIRELSGENALILGFGSIGNRIGDLLNAFSVNVSVYDVKKPKENYVKNYYSSGSLSEAVLNKEIIIISLPLIKSTYHIFNNKVLKNISKNSLIINISRGGIIDENLIPYYTSKENLKFILDVFEIEPLPMDSILWKNQDVYISPHNAFVSNKNDKRLNNLFQDNVRKYL